MLVARGIYEDNENKVKTLKMENQSCAEKLRDSHEVCKCRPSRA